MATPCRSRNSPTPAGSTGRWATPPSTNASARATWRRSSPRTPTPPLRRPARRAGENRSLTQGTAGWAALGSHHAAPRAVADVDADIATTTRTHASGGPPMTHHEARTATAAPPAAGARGAAATRRRRSVAAPAADAAHPRRRPRRPGHRQVATLGTGRSAAGPVHRRGRRPGPVRRWPPAGRGAGVPHREDVPRLETRSVAPSRRPPSRRCGPWNGCTARRTSSSADRPAPGRRSCSKPSASSPSNRDCTSPGSPWKTSAGCIRRHRADDTVSKAIAKILRAEIVVVDLCRHRDYAEELRRGQAADA